MSILVGPISGALVAGGVRRFLLSHCLRHMKFATGLLWVLNTDADKVSGRGMRVYGFHHIDTTNRTEKHRTEYAILRVCHEVN